jgi:hypothetical protein
MSKPNVCNEFLSTAPFYLTSVARNTRVAPAETCIPLQAPSILETTSYDTGQRDMFGNPKTLRELTGVPNPVTASQPFVAGKPLVLQPVAEPIVTSLKASKPFG